MKTLVRINGKVEEFTSVKIDTLSNKATVEKDFSPMVDIDRKGVFVEINIYGDPKEFEK